MQDMPYLPPLIVIVITLWRLPLTIQQAFLQKDISNKERRSFISKNFISLFADIACFIYGTYIYRKMYRKCFVAEILSNISTSSVAIITMTVWRLYLLIQRVKNRKVIRFSHQIQLSLQTHFINTSSPYDRKPPICIDLYGENSVKAGWRIFPSFLQR